MDGKVALLIGAILLLLYQSAYARWRTKQLMIALGLVAVTGMLLVYLVDQWLETTL